MDFNISLPDAEEKLRRAFRTRVPGLTVEFLEQGKTLPVKDISATGFAVEGDSTMREGTSHPVKLLLNGKLFLSDIKANVIRVAENGIAGLNFEQLDRRQQQRLDKLVLEVQKRLIALKKNKDK
ncbi:PilZ domain-containing protein [Desulfovibrio oxyclinae]|uniref:PilZ domain-containing protein n=1 Tax=Desulfovibrio oxyclinae TaxID=63560 RepID=UPI00036F2765|nr:PilZ domain-containing protein [Desulfovibrio oxyclinae]